MAEFMRRHPKCVGCDRVEGDWGCEVYAEPQSQHSRIQGCAMRTHDKPVNIKEPTFVDPLKKSKQGAKKR